MSMVCDIGCWGSQAHPNLHARTLYGSGALAAMAFPRSHALRGNAYILHNSIGPWGLLKFGSRSHALRGNAYIASISVGPGAGLLQFVGWGE